MSSIDRLCEILETDKKSLYGFIIIASAFILSIISVLLIIFLWSAMVIYWLIPIDTSGDMYITRGFLVMCGSILIGGIYVCLIVKIMDG